MDIEVEKVNVSSQGKRKLKATWTIEHVEHQCLWACGRYRRLSEFMTRFFYSTWNYNKRVVAWRKKHDIWGMDDEMREHIDEELIQGIKDQANKPL